MEITTFVHSTEDHVKVVKAVSNLFPQEVDSPPYEEIKLTGVFGDQLKMLKWVLKNRRPATSVLENILRGLTSIDTQELLDSLETCIDENKNLYIRLDKQKAHQGIIKIRKRDPIRFKARLNIPHKTDPVKLMYLYVQELRQDA